MSDTENYPRTPKLEPNYDRSTFEHIETEEEPKSEGYTTPPGVDERIAPWPSSMEEEDIERMEKQGFKLVLWNGFRVIVSEQGHTTEFLNELSARKRKNQSIIALFTGAPGTGKTYSALRLGEMLDPKFDPTVQICFTRETILYLFGPLSPLKRGQVIIIDESHFTAGSRSWYDDIQKDMMNNLAAIRSKGYIILIVCLHRDMLDKIIRKYVLSYQLHMEHRGTSTVYRLRTPRFESEVFKKKICTLELSLPGVEYCINDDCLTCHFLYPNARTIARYSLDADDPFCYNLRAIYERMKRDFLDMKSTEAQEKQEEKAMKEGLPSMRRLLPLIYEHKDKLELNRVGNIQNTTIRAVVDELGWAVGRGKSIEIGKFLLASYPGLREELKEPTL